jgi:hypothetical protein
MTREKRSLKKEACVKRYAWTTMLAVGGGMRMQ